MPAIASLIMKMIADLVLQSCAYFYATAQFDVFCLSGPREPGCLALQISRAQEFRQNDRNARTLIKITPFH